MSRCGEIVWKGSEGCTYCESLTESHRHSCDSKVVSHFRKSVLGTPSPTLHNIRIDGVLHPLLHACMPHPNDSPEVNTVIPNCTITISRPTVSIICSILNPPSCIISQAVKGSFTPWPMTLRTVLVQQIWDIALWACGDCTWLLGYVVGSPNQKKIAGNT